MPVAAPTLAPPVRAADLSARTLALPVRNAELSARGLLEPAPEMSTIAEMVARSTGVPIALVTVVDEHNQTFLGSCGLPPDLSAAGGTRRSWSFCQHAVAACAPLVVEDATLHPVLAATPLVEMGLVRAYAGVPVDVEGVGVVGTVCALSDRPHVFDEGALASVRLAARLVGELLTKRARDTAARTPRPDAAFDADIGVGELLDGKYWITAKLGEGGQGRVFLARDRLLGQLVAIKVSPMADVMLMREAETLARLRHPSIVQLHGWGRLNDGAMYLVLEYVPGETLESRSDAAHLADRPLPSDLVIETTTQLAGALASMHALGVVHGDVKPSNVILDPLLDRAVLIDFGLGLRIDAPEAGELPCIGGTPGWSAPEQLVSEGVSPRHPSVDVYALAAVAYAMLTGTGPFESTEPTSAVGRQLLDSPSPLSAVRPDLPHEVEDVLRRALSRERWKRYASPIAFAEAFRIAMRSASAGPPPVSGGEPRSRAIVLRTAREKVREMLGEEAEGRILSSLLPTHRDAFFRAFDDHENSLYPSEVFAAYLRAACDAEPRAAEIVGERLGGPMRATIRTLQISRTPESILAAVGTMLRRFHTWGRVTVKQRTGASAATLRLLLPEGFAPVLCAYFGGMLRAMLRETGKAVELSQAECMAHGAAACAFDIHWRDEHPV